MTTDPHTNPGEIPEITRALAGVYGPQGGVYGPQGGLYGPQGGLLLAIYIQNK